jgi:putative ABC transport system permease protein
MSREQFRIAVQNLRANRTRTLLTTLGIVIGVASITLVLSLGEGVRQVVGNQVERLGGNVIIVIPGQNNTQSIASYNPYNTAMTTTLTERDYASTQSIKNVQQVAPVMLLSGNVRDGSGKSRNVPIVATSQSLVSVLDLTISSGQFIDSQTSRDTVVLGQRLAIDLFGTDQAMGQSIMVKGRPHTVIGVIQKHKHPH